MGVQGGLLRPVEWRNRTGTTGRSQVTLGQFVRDRRGQCEIQRYSTALGLIDRSQDTRASAAGTGLSLFKSRSYLACDVLRRLYGVLLFLVACPIQLKHFTAASGSALPAGFCVSRAERVPSWLCRLFFCLKLQMGNITSTSPPLGSSFSSYGIYSSPSSTSYVSSQWDMPGTPSCRGVPGQASEADAQAASAGSFSMRRSSGFTSSSSSKGAPNHPAEETACICDPQDCPPAAAVVGAE